MVLTEKEIREVRQEAAEKGLKPWRFRILALERSGTAGDVSGRLIDLKVGDGESMVVDAEGARLEAIEEIESRIEATDVIFISEEVDREKSVFPVAEICKKKGAIVVSVVNVSFAQGEARMDLVVQALRKLEQVADTVIVIDDDKLGTPISQSINVLLDVVKGVAETITLPSLININFADFRTMMEHGDLAVISTGESDEPNRAKKAAAKAMKNLLLDVNHKAANGALISISGGQDLTLDEAVKTADSVTDMLDEKALVIWGARVDPLLGECLKITIVLTGIDSSQILNEYCFLREELYNLEPYAEPEKPLKIDLNLYQMETKEE